jgi:hypothetical protein
MLLLGTRCIFHTLSSICSIEVAVVGGYNLSGLLMARLVEAIPQAS